MIYLSNQNIAQLLTPKDCIEALDEAFHALARGEAASRPRTDVWVPCGRDDGYYRWGSMEGAIVRKISQVKVYSPTQAHRETFAKEMSRELGISVEPFDDPEPVVRGSDIVTTCTDSNKLVVTDPTWIEKGMHLANCSSREFSLEIVKHCDIVAQVGTETFGAKGGMAESERHHGWASWVVGRPEQQARIPKRPVSNLDFVNYPSLTDLLNNPSMRRRSAAQITFFHNLGLLGFQFAAVAAKAYQIARAKGVGLAMSTDPFLQDIRD